MSRSLQNVLFRITIYDESLYEMKLFVTNLNNLRLSKVRLIDKFQLHQNYYKSHSRRS